MQFFPLVVLSVLMLAVLSGCSSRQYKVSAPCQEFAQALVEARALIQMPGAAAPQCQVLSKELFLETLSKLFAEEETPEEYALSEIAFKGIGLIPEDYAYARCVKSAYISQASAGYSAKLKSVLIPDWYRIPFPVLLHEATHFLQDEQVNTPSLAGYSGLFHDSALALGATFEGDAMLQEDRYMQAKSIDPESTLLPDSGRLAPVEAACELPDSLRRLFEFQYLQGTLFWKRLRSFAPSRTRFETLAHPPRSTREIIAPKEYLARVTQASIQEPVCALRSSKTPAYERALGELMLRVTLEQTLGPRKSFEAARGLRDDCLRLLPAGSGYRLEWMLLFSNTKERDQALLALNERYKHMQFEITVSSPVQIRVTRAVG